MDYFPLAGPCQDSDVLPFCRALVFVIVDCVHQGIASVDERDLPGFEIGDFEGENYEEAVYPGLQLAVAALTRGPGLGGYIVKDADAVLVAEAR